MRNKILVIALVVVGLVSVGYAAYTQTLAINGTGTANASWNVKITNIVRASATGVTDATAPSYTDTSATFNANLAYPGATATYNVTVTNGGSIPAKLNSITDLTATNAAAPTYITYAVSGVTAGTTTLAAGATNTVQVTVTWDAASNPDTSTGNSKSATINLGYVQD
jgi:uncharacterized repeat protein (TIGR01451 family)